MSQPSHEPFDTMEIRADAIMESASGKSIAYSVHLKGGGGLLNCRVKLGESITVEKTEHGYRVGGATIERQRPLDWEL